MLCSYVCYLPGCCVVSGRHVFMSSVLNWISEIVFTTLTPDFDLVTSKSGVDRDQSSRAHSPETICLH